ncbi:hypothetical protein [Microbispora sp. GKU 823]|uniref:hypothetical protein n=1 Tax=Microbispora sp. GKU 823 TaxID=1652100 RepID=UPI0009A3BAC2|nr:hypothetical protein [Microbispora sp. GKU 823]OPG09299.1 hypothetical protein B1L11_26185 [Microbispora sp. GKU 823]
MHDVTGTPEPEDVSALISETEAFLASQQPATAPAASAAVDGETKRVRQLRAEVGEAALLAELQNDETPLRLDTDRVRKRRKKAHEAARLHQLAQDPVMRAWQAARMRRLLVGASMVSLALALTWSTAGVQVFAAEGAAMWSPAWIFAWFVEPFMSLALLVVVGAKAYLGTRGQPIQSKTLTRIEWLFLTLTLGMNAWRHLPGVADEFSLSALVLHILGPVVAVAVVTALPIILAAFTDLDHGTRATRPEPVRAPVPSPRRRPRPSPLSSSGWGRAGPRPPPRRAAVLWTSTGSNCGA